ncbi:MAG: sodium-dependent transporter [Deltaproteobacteria bacterium]|nr:MAG: sodium-dependent transporter [Deltaproteobacteria bacterium]
MSDPSLDNYSPDRGQWGSRLGFILAAAGSAVGLGNIWKFPYITGENGGGLFVLVYLVCIALVGLPIMVGELMIGRAARKQPVGAFTALSGPSSGWRIVGWLGIITGFIILSYYIVVAGWAMDYTLKSVANFTDPIAETASAEAKAYRATTPLEEMRAALVVDRANRATVEKVAEVRGEAPRSAWKAWEIYQKALTEAAAPGGAGVATAEAALLEDAEFARKIDLVRPVAARIDKLRADAKAEAAAFYAAAEPKQIRDAAETLDRRHHIADAVGKAFGTVVTDGWTGTFWALLFMLITVLVVAGGVSSGIERVSRVLMPLLVGILVVMVAYSAFQPGFGPAVSFVFEPNPSRLKASGVLEALGHAFFTLSLGMGAMITYGSYQAKKENLVRQSILIAGLDTAIALLACLMLFPIIFSYGQEPAAGPGLVFKSMPLAFAEIGSGGMLLAILFFALLVVAALTSAISLLEVVASYFIDQRGWSRGKAAWIIGGVIFLFGVPSAFSFDPDFALASWEPTFGKSFFDTMDYLASNWLLPIGGLLVAIYAGWFMPKRIRRAELEGMSAAVIQGWLGLIRYVAPALVALVILQKVGILTLD